MLCLFLCDNLTSGDSSSQQQHPGRHDILTTDRYIHTHGDTPVKIINKVDMSVLPRIVKKQNR